VAPVANSLHTPARPAAGPHTAVLGNDRAACTCCGAIGFGNSKHRGTESPKLPRPLAQCRPSSNTAMPGPTARTIPNHSSDGSCTFAQLRRKVSIDFNGAPPIFPQNYPFPYTDSQTPHNLFLIYGLVRPTMPNGIQIRSVVFPQCTGQTD